MKPKLFLGYRRVKVEKYLEAKAWFTDTENIYKLFENINESLLLAWMTSSEQQTPLGFLHS